MNGHLLSVREVSGPPIRGTWIGAYLLPFAQGPKREPRGVQTRQFGIASRRRTGLYKKRGGFHVGVIPALFPTTAPLPSPPTATSSPSPRKIGVSRPKATKEGGGPDGPWRLARAAALEQRFVERGWVMPEAVDAFVKDHEQDIGPLNRVKVVAHAWVDLEYNRRPLADGTAAIAGWASAAPKRAS